MIKFSFKSGVEMKEFPERGHFITDGTCVFVKIPEFVTNGNKYNAYNISYSTFVFVEYDRIVHSVIIKNIDFEVEI